MSKLSLLPALEFLDIARRTRLPYEYISFLGEQNPKLRKIRTTFYADETPWRQCAVLWEHSEGQWKSHDVTCLRYWDLLVHGEFKRS